MLNVLVLGSAGMAGHVISLYLEGNSGLNVLNLSHQCRFNSNTEVMDVCDREKFNAYLDMVKADIIINCIGVLNRSAEERKPDAVYLNGYLPHFLEYKYKGTYTRIIHLSTDCVFSGKTGGYTEDSLRDGDSFYSRTKTVGELINEKDITFRTSIIGPDMNIDGIGLFNWFMKSTGEISGYTNAVWTGITTIELAKAVEKAIFSRIAGMYHLVPESSISKYDLLDLFKGKFNRRDVTVKKHQQAVAVDKSLINTRRDFDHNIPGYGEMLDQMKQWICEHKQLYPHYII